MKSPKETLLPIFAAWETWYLPIIFRLIVYAPWSWLMLFWLFILAVMLQVGHLPTYGLPDPKYAGPSSLFYMPTILLLIWVMSTTPVGVILTVIRLWKGFPKSVMWREVIFYWSGVGLFYLFIFNDVAGLMTWLAD